MKNRILEDLRETIEIAIDESGDLLFEAAEKGREALRLLEEGKYTEARKALNEAWDIEYAHGSRTWVVWLIASIDAMILGYMQLPEEMLGLLLSSNEDEVDVGADWYQEKTGGPRYDVSALHHLPLTRRLRL